MSLRTTESECGRDLSRFDAQATEASLARHEGEALGLVLRPKAAVEEREL